MSSSHSVSACPCHLADMDRQPRSGWMRLLPWLRLYRCSRCNKPQLLSKQKVDNARILHAAQVRARGG